MALVLGVAQGDIIDIADNWIALLSINSAASATFIGDDGSKFDLHRECETEIIPGVWAQLDPDAANHRLRLRFDAPKHISITRRGSPPNRP
jgi:hypothetical protein